MVDLLVEAAVIVVSVGGLWLGARTLVGAAVRLARAAGLSELVVGLTVVALGTSSPEFVVTADAALSGLGDIAVGNVVGSNVFNLAAVLGLVSLVRVVPVERSLVHRDGVALVLATLLGAAALLDLTVSRPEGAVLVGALVAYTGYLLWSDGGRDDGVGVAADDGVGVAADDESGSTPGDGRGSAPDAGAADAEGGHATEPAVPIGHSDRAALTGRNAALLVAGLVVVLASGHFLVASAATVARAAGVSEWVVGGTVVAAGTSTPEFAVSLLAMRRESVGISVGNVVGSNVANTLGVLGVGALLSPLSVAPAALETVAWLTVLVLVTVAALWSGRKLSRAEGALLAASEALRWALGLSGLFG